MTFSQVHDIDIFKKCWYFDNWHGLLICWAPLYATELNSEHVKIKLVWSDFVPWQRPHHSLTCIYYSYHDDWLLWSRARSDPFNSLIAIDWSLWLPFHVTYHRLDTTRVEKSGSSDTLLGDICIYQAEENSGSQKKSCLFSTMRAALSTQFFTDILPHLFNVSDDSKI